MTYRDNARDLTGEVDSLAERVAKLEEKPAKAPSKPWTKVMWASVSVIVGLAMFIAAGIAGSVSSHVEPLVWALGIVGAICVFGAPI